MTSTWKHGNFSWTSREFRERVWWMQMSFPHWGDRANSTFPNPLTGFRGPLPGGRERRYIKGQEGRGKERKARDGKNGRKTYTCSKKILVTVLCSFIKRLLHSERDSSSGTRGTYSREVDVRDSSSGTRGTYSREADVRETRLAVHVVRIQSWSWCEIDSSSGTRGTYTVVKLMWERLV